MISAVEWSGILLYTVTGDITKPDQTSFTLKDIIPMHKGTGTYTEYSFNEPKRDMSGYEDKHIDYVNENPEALEWKVGHIHSHNNMAVFFSGTDMEELVDNSASHNFYLSVIVNNRMDIIANLAFRGIASVEGPVTFEALDIDGNSYQIEHSKFFVKKEKMYYYQCEIDKPSVELDLDKDFLRGVSDIIEKAEEKKVPVKSVQSTLPGFSTVYTKPSKSEPQPNIFDEEEEDLEFAEYFAMNVFLAGDVDHGVYLHFEDVLEEIEMLKVPAKDVINSILSNYWAVFSNFFEGDETAENFVEATDDLIEFLKDYHMSYPFTRQVVKALERMLHNFNSKEVRNAGRTV